MSSPEASPDPPSPKAFTASGPYSSYVLALLFFVAALNMLDRQILGMLVVPIKAEFGVSDTAIGFLTGPSFALFYATRSKLFTSRVFLRHRCLSVTILVPSPR